MKLSSILVRHILLCGFLPLLSGCIESENTQVQLGEEFRLHPTISVYGKQRTPTNSKTVNYKVTFSAPIEAESFTAGDIVNAGSAKGVTWGSPIDLTGKALEFQIMTSQIETEGTILPVLAGGSVVDKRGRVNEESLSGGSLSVLVDLTPPEAPTNLELISEEEFFSDFISFFFLLNTPKLRWKASSDALSGIKTYEAKVVRSSDDQVVLDWTPIVMNGNLSYLWPPNYGMEHKILLRAVDLAGNTSPVSYGPSWLTQPTGFQRVFEEEDEIYFGSAVAMSENWAAITAETGVWPSFSHLVFFKKTNGKWERTQVIDSANVICGECLAFTMTDDLMVIGSHIASPPDFETPESRGVVFIIARDPTTSQWAIVQTLWRPLTEPTQDFGSGVAIVEDKILVAAPYCPSDPGHGCIIEYEQQDGTWVETGVQLQSEASGNGLMALASDGNRLVLNLLESGEIYFWRNQSSQWTFEGSLTEQSTYAKISLDQDRLAITHDNLIKIYRYEGGTQWTLDSAANCDRNNFGAVHLRGQKLLCQDRDSQSKRYGLREFMWQDGQGISSWYFLPPDGHVYDFFGSQLAANSTEFLVSGYQWSGKKRNQIWEQQRGAAYFGPR